MATEKVSGHEGDGDSLNAMMVTAGHDGDGAPMGLHGHKGDGDPLGAMMVSAGHDGDGAPLGLYDTRYLAMECVALSATEKRYPAMRATETPWAP